MTLCLRTHIILAALLWSAFVFAVPPAAKAGQILGAPTYIGLNSGLVGYWSFNGDDMYSNNRAADTSGNANHGTRSSSPTIEIGKIGQALEFTDGSNDVVTIQPSASLDDMAQMSISFWMYTRSTPDFGAILYKMDSNTALDGWGIDDCGCGSNDIGFFVGYSGSSGLWAVTNTAPIQLNQWQHVVVTWDGSADGGATFYIDGTARTHDINDTGTLPRDADSDDTLKMFNDSDGGDAYGASMDELRIYNRVLTADEVKGLYKIGSTAKIGAPNNTGSLSSGLVGWWTFDGNDTFSSGKTADRSVGGNTGTLLGGTAQAIGKVGQGLRFDGVDDNVNFGDISTVGTVTVAAWVRPGAVAVNQRIVSKWTEEYVLSTDDSVANQFTFGAFADDDNDICDSNVSGGAYTVGTWVFVVGMYASETCRIYVNGVDVTTVQQDDATGVIENTSRPLRVGIEGEDGVSNPFNGTIDDLRIYNRALSADEIKRLYKIGNTLRQGVASSNGSLSQGLVGWWTFDGNDTSYNSAGILTMIDKSGAGNHGTSVSAATNPTTTPGKIGQALNFATGLSTQINAVSGGELANLSTTTMALWVKRASSADSAFLYKANDNSDNTGWWFDMDNAEGGGMCFRVVRGNNNMDMCTSSEPAVDEWTHIAVSWADGFSTDRIRIYMNGAEVALGSGGANTDPGSGSHGDDSPYPFEIGGTGGGSTGRFTGQMDDVRVYRRVLSPDEIKRLYNMGR